jgi:hypothetical protein
MYSIGVGCGSSSSSSISSNMVVLGTEIYIYYTLCSVSEYMCVRERKVSKANNNLHVLCLPQVNLGFAAVATSSVECI